MRHTLILIILCALSVVARAQDKIYCRDGKVIDGRVARVGTKTIIYRKTHDEDVEYTIQRKDVTRIVYANGVVDDFGGTGGTSGKKPRPYYGKNIISVMPAVYTACIDNSMSDPGIGVSYERLLDDHGHIGLYLPVIVNFPSVRDYEGPLGGSGSGLPTYNSYCFMPGVKFYPGPGSDKVRYSIGGSFFLITGKEPYMVYAANTYSTGTPSGTYTYSMFGLMINNSVSFMASRHVCMSFNIVAGIPFSDNRYANYEGDIGVTAPLVQFSLQMGYRN
jgi:hypothetical protein